MAFPLSSPLHYSSQTCGPNKPWHGVRPPHASEGGTARLAQGPHIGPVLVPAQERREGGGRGQQCCVAAWRPEQGSATWQRICLGGRGPGLLRLPLPSLGVPPRREDTCTGALLPGLTPRAAAQRALPSSAPPAPAAQQGRGDEALGGSAEPGEPHSISSSSVSLQGLSRKATRAGGQHFSLRATFPLLQATSLLGSLEPRGRRREPGCSRHPRPPREPSGGRSGAPWLPGPSCPDRPAGNQWLRQEGSRGTGRSAVQDSTGPRRHSSGRH